MVVKKLVVEKEMRSQERLSGALVVARHALALVYTKKFQAAHPGKKPSQVLDSNKKALEFLKKAQNDALKKCIQTNDVEQYDISALCFLLKHYCGLKAWNNTNSLEGNIQVIRKMRNAVFHWTPGSQHQDECEETWNILVQTIEKLLTKAQLEDHLPKLLASLKNEKSTKMVKSSRPEISDCLRNDLDEAYRKDRKTTLLSLVWAGRNLDFHHHVSRTYTPATFTTHTTRGVVKLDGERLWEAPGEARVVVLEGDTGTGKTSLLKHYAAAWAAHRPPFHHLHYLVLLDLTTVTVRTFTLSDVVQEIFPSSCAIYKQEKILKELTKAEDKVMFLIDAFDERVKAFKVTFQSLLKRFPKALFVVTTRPHCTASITKLCEEPHSVVTAQGFSPKQALDYSTKLFSLHGKENNLQDFIKKISGYPEILAIPQLLCWSSWFWLEKGKELFTTRGSVYASLTDFLLRKMCHINGKRVLAAELPPEGRKWQQHISKLAFSQMNWNFKSLNENSREIKLLVKKATGLGIRPYEALSSLMQSESLLTGNGEQLRFQFSHNIHASFLAAHHLAQKLLVNTSISLPSLLHRLPNHEKRSILSFTVSHLYKDNKPITEELLEKLVNISKELTSHTDISFYLDLIEESCFNIHLVKALAKSMPHDDHTRLNHDTKASGQLWLRMRELQRGVALLLLLQAAQPARLWLRLCQGPHNDDDDPVPGHQVSHGDPVEAMRIITKAYAKTHLPELRVSDLEVRTPLSWPRNVWWLSLERCSIRGDLGLRSGLLKLSLIECTGLNKLKCPTDLQTLKLKNMNIDQLTLPDNIETLILDNCSISRLQFLPANLHTLKFTNCKLETEVFQTSIATHQKVNKEFFTRLANSFSNMKKLRNLTITDMNITPEDFIPFLQDFGTVCPQGQLVMKSTCGFSLRSSAKSTLLSILKNFSLLQVSISFAQDIVTSP